MRKKCLTLEKKEVRAMLVPTTKVSIMH
jgi:hypothetical protein